MTDRRTELGKNGMMRGTSASTVIVTVSVFTATNAADVVCPPASMTKFSAARWPRRAATSLGIRATDAAAAPSAAAAPAMLDAWKYKPACIASIINKMITGITNTTCAETSPRSR